MVQQVLESYVQLQVDAVITLAVHCLPQKFPVKWVTHVRNICVAVEHRVDCTAVACPECTCKLFVGISYVDTVAEP